MLGVVARHGIEGNRVRPTAEEREERAATPAPVESRVRVAIVTWNAAAFIADALTALPDALAAWAPATEIVVVDNASVDDTVARCRSLGVTVIANADNVGYARAVNQAFAGSDAEFLVALNPDARPAPGSIAALLDRLAADPSIGLIAPRLIGDDGRLQHSAHRFPSLALAAITGFVPMRLRRGALGDRWLLEGFAQERHHRVGDIDWAIGALHVIRADAVGRAPYRERWFMYIEDLDLCDRIHRAGLRVVLAGDVEVAHIGNASGKTAFGNRRETRWLDAMYDWYALTRGSARARLWGLVNSAGLFTKLAVLRALQALHRADAAVEAKAQSRRRLAYYHLRKFRRGPRLPEASQRPPASPVPRRILAVNAGGLFSGAERALLRVLATARTAGWDVRVAASDGPLIAAAAAAGIDTVAISDLRLPAGPRPLAAIRLLGRTVRGAREVARLRRDDEIVVINSLNALAITRGLPPEVPVVFFAHDVATRGDRRALLRLAAGRVDLAIAVSEAVAEGLRPLGIPTEVVYNGTPIPVDRAALAASAHSRAADSGPVIGISGLLTPWKGHEVLLEAFARLAHPTARLEILGATLPNDRAYAARLRARAARPDLAGRVTFIDPAENPITDPLTVMARWTSLVSASTEPEAGPLVALEAMSLGVPVVATSHGGVIEFLGDAGLLVTPGDPDALRGALDRLLGDDARRARMAEAGPRIVTQRRLDLAHQSARWVDVLAATARGAAT